MTSGVTVTTDTAARIALPLRTEAVLYRMAIPETVPIADKSMKLIGVDVLVFCLARAVEM